MDTIIPQKQCLSCLQFLPATTEYFHVHKRGSYGFRSPCKECWKKAYYLVHPPKVAIEGMKQCTACNRLLPATLEYFHAVHTTKSGLRNNCRECRSIERKTYRKENPEQVHAYEQSRLDTHREQSQKHKNAHREEYRQAGREYWKANPEKAKIINSNRRARIMKAEGMHTVADIRKQYINQKGKCYYCSAKLGKSKNAFHIDHIIPVIRGGSNDPENLVLACPSCNLSKGKKLLHEWPKGNRLL